MELEQQYPAAEMNDKILMGKILEVKGRRVVASRGQESTQVEIRANSRRGQDLIQSTMPMGPTTMPATTPPTTTTAPTTPLPEMEAHWTRRSRSVSPSPSLMRPENLVPAAKPKALPKAKSEPNLNHVAEDVIVIHSEDEEADSPDFGRR